MQSWWVLQFHAFEEDWQVNHYHSLPCVSSRILIISSFMAYHDLL